jgi:hypothetical protein
MEAFLGQVARQVPKQLDVARRLIEIMQSWPREVKAL